MASNKIKQNSTIIRLWRERNFIYSHIFLLNDNYILKSLFVFFSFFGYIESFLNFFFEGSFIIQYNKNILFEFLFVNLWNFNAKYFTDIKCLKFIIRLKVFEVRELWIWKFLEVYEKVIECKNYQEQSSHAWMKWSF